MAIEILVPRLGWNMEQGTFLGWLKREGEPVQAGDRLFTLEGDKAVQEIEATDSGILRLAPNGPKEGETVAVGTVLGYLTAAGVDLGTGPAAPAVSSAAPQVRPAARRDAPAGSSARQAARGPVITPRARRAATKLGVDWSQVQGTGRNGRIRERDIVGRTAGPTNVRRVIAERMLHSLRSTAPVTLTTTADATKLVGLRQQFRAAAASEAVVPSYTDFLVKLAALALQAHPALNARWQDERIVTFREVHVGVAVDTEAGLLVPVIRNVERLTVRDLARRSKDLLDRARTRRLAAEEMQGGTFTVSNLGSFGIDAFTPIINWPECAILGIGRIHKRPAVVDDQVVPRDVVTLSLTFDHCRVDGAPAGRFLQTLCAVIEDPALWLVG